MSGRAGQGVAGCRCHDRGGVTDCWPRTCVRAQRTPCVKLCLGRIKVHSDRRAGRGLRTHPPANPHRETKPGATPATRRTPRAALRRRPPPPASKASSSRSANGAVAFPSNALTIAAGTPSLARMLPIATQPAPTAAPIAGFTRAPW